MAILTLTAYNDKKTGTAAADSINGLAGNDIITGLADHDTLLGGVGHDSLDGGAGNDSLLGDAGDDTLLGGTGHNFLDGGADNDRLHGGNDNDTLDGGTGADNMTGGDGNDVYFVDNMIDRIVEASGRTSGTDSVKSSIDYTLPANIENLELTGMVNLKGTGNDGNNLITGNAGDNVLDGKIGFDTLMGGDGDDTLMGGTGVDMLTGGDGSDTYRVSSIEDKIVETARDGDMDVIESTVNYALGANIEVLVLMGASAIEGTGNELDNTLIGNTASNRLHGWVGNDSLIGDAGDDTLEGGTGDDSIDGGKGQDLVLYSGNQSDYNIIPGNDDQTWIVEDVNGTYGDGVDEGTDTLVNVESLMFADRAVNLNQQGSVGPQVDSTPPELSFQDISITEGNSGSKLASFQLTLSRAATEPVSVDYSTVDVTATAGSDYTPQTGTLTFAPGETRQSLSLRILGDTRMEPHETFWLQLGNPVGVNLRKSIATVTLANDDTIIQTTPPALTLSSDKTTLKAGDSATIRFSFSTRPQGFDASDILVSGGNLTGLTADATGFNYTAKFTPVANTNNLAASISVSSGSYFNVQGTPGLASNTLNFTGDTQIPNLTLSSDKTRLNTGETATVSFNFSEVPYGFTRDDLLVTGGSLGTLQADVSGRFYTALFTPAAATSTLSVQNGSYTDAVGNRGTVNNGLSLTLMQNQLLPTLTLTGATVSEGQSGMTYANLNLSLSASSSQTVTVNYVTQDGTAQAGSDYQAGSDVIRFAPGQTTANIQIAVLGDTLTESTETFKLRLTNPNNATLAVSEAVITINDDDPQNDMTNSQQGTLANEELDGTAAADYLQGLGGDDTLIGLAGADTLDGGTGYDSLDGGEGNDRLLGGDENDILVGGTGDDTLEGGAGDDNLQGGDGSDRLVGGIGGDTMSGGAGDDRYEVNHRNDRIVETGQANGGVDTVESFINFSLATSGLENLENLTLLDMLFLKATGNDRDNLITGNLGDNVLNGEGGKDTLIGGEGDDTLDGGGSADRLEGGLGDDTYLINSNDDTIIEQTNSGEADVVIASLTYTLVDQVEVLTLTGSGVIDGFGNAQDNIITGNRQNNRLLGKNGNDDLAGDLGADTLEGGVGNDSLDGGDGYDTAVFNAGYGNFKLTLDDGSWMVKDSRDVAEEEGEDVVKNVEKLAFDDRNLYWFDTPKSAPESSDFLSGTDQIGVLASAFGFSVPKSSVMNLSASAFYAAPGATIGHDADDRFLYDTDTGQVRFDNDGNGANPAVPLMILTGQPPLVAGDVMLWG